MAGIDYNAIPQFNQKQVALFWAKVDIRGPDECWPWKGPLNRFGYGRVNITQTKTSTTANRMAYALSKGPLGPKIQACHACDVRYPKGSLEHRRCCNPAHLFAGTAATNYADMVAKGRAVHPRGRQHGEPGLKGSKHPQAILAESQVIEIRARLADGAANAAALGREYGVSGDTIRRIRDRTLWRHI